jgi:hypothetical protein
LHDSLTKQNNAALIHAKVTHAHNDPGATALLFDELRCEPIIDASRLRHPAAKILMIIEGVDPSSGSYHCSWLIVDQMNTHLGASPDSRDSGGSVATNRLVFRLTYATWNDAGRSPDGELEEFDCISSRLPFPIAGRVSDIGTGKRHDHSPFVTTQRVAMIQKAGTVLADSGHEPG